MPNLARNLESSSRAVRPSLTDKPIDYSIPYRVREKGASRHYGFFPYPARKPWPVVQEYINHYTSPGELVCNPFSGNGVTAVESLVLGRRAVTTDINPVARFVTRMTAVSPVNLDALKVAFEFVRSVSQKGIELLDSMSESEVRGLLRTLDYPRTPIPDTVRRAGAKTVDQLHTPRQLAGLTLLRDAINQVSDDLVRDLLLLGLAKTVRYANKMYSLPVAPEGKQRRSPYGGNANFLRRYSYSLTDEEHFYEHRVWPAFEHTMKSVFEAKAETNQLIGNRFNDTNFILGDIPAARIHELTGEGAVDYCFTDPPYSNEIFFVDLSTIWAAWLGFEITDETRREELTEGGAEDKSRPRFVQEFAAAMESIARALKPDRWFTLVFKHIDLSLWSSIVAACEQSGLQYVNSVWQDVTITSTRQLESPNVNPKGDMYLNFRKMSRQKFERIYRAAEVTALPTRPVYLQREIERIVVSYLGADISLITSAVIQQILDSRAFRNYQENPENLEKDIRKTVRESPRFTTWQPGTNGTQWVLAPQEAPDLSLPPLDRARYYTFDFLKQRGEATDGEVTRNLLTRLANEPRREIVRSDARALLRHVGNEISHRRWRFDESRVARYKQLRLFFQRSSADELRERIEDREGRREAPLRPDYEGLTLLLDRLRLANQANNQFESQWARLLNVLKITLQRIVDNFEDQVERVLAVGEWAQFGIDLRNVPFEDVLLQIVLRSAERPFSLYQLVAERVFANLNDDNILVQFQLMTTGEWEHAVELAVSNEEKEALGITLLGRV